MDRIELEFDITKITPPVALKLLEHTDREITVQVELIMHINKLSSLAIGVCGSGAVLSENPESAQMKSFLEPMIGILEKVRRDCEVAVEVRLRLGLLERKEVREMVFNELARHTFRKLRRRSQPTRVNGVLVNEDLVRWWYFVDLIALGFGVNVACLKDISGLAKEKRESVASTEKKQKH